MLNTNTKKRKTDSTDNIHSVQTISTNNSSGVGTAIYIFNGVVPSNPLITILEEKLKPFIFHFLDSVTFRFFEKNISLKKCYSIDCNY
jgi:hypothetical protein